LDFYFHMLIITDENDADGDSIPDFSDTRDDSVPLPPSLELAVDGSSLVFTIRGEAGRSYSLIRKTRLSDSAPAAEHPVTMTQTVQTITLPPPTVATAFWYLQVL